MIEKLPTLVQLLKQLPQSPYLASKNVYRVAHYLLDMNPKKAEQLCATILEAKKNIVRCNTCCSWQERTQTCLFCDNSKRDQAIICVVETWQEQISIEKAGGYNGVYHILGGVICPLEGMGPEDLTIDGLLARCNNGITQEIILATNQTPEGEATAAYIAHKLKGNPVKISCLARGIPVGSSLEFMDRVTIFKALSERRPF